MKIAIHVNELCGRGTGKTPYDYAVGLRNQCGHEVIFFTSGLSANESLPRIARDFPVYTYPKKVDQHRATEVQAELRQLVDQHRVEFLHLLKFGHDDGITPGNCRTGIHCVFVMTQPHGDVYAGVSDTLARKFRQPLHVPHMIKVLPPSRDMRAALGIPKSAFVFGRHGGPGTFNLPFVHNAIRRALDARPDLHFVFLSTNRFVTHPRVHHVPWVESEQEKFDVIHACDAMIHGRSDGETFGIAVGEFSAANKPVVTWTGQGAPGYDRAHLDILGTRALLYTAENDLFAILTRLDRRFTDGRNWDMYTARFSEENVTRQYVSVFLGTSDVRRGQPAGKESCP